MKQYKSSIVQSDWKKSTIDGKEFTTASLLVFLIISFLVIKTFVYSANDKE